MKLKSMSWFSNLNMRNKTLLILLPVLIVFLSATIIIYSTLMRGLKQQLLINNYQTLMMINNDISAALSTMENSLPDITRNKVIQDYLYGKNSRRDKTAAQRFLTRMFNNETSISIPYTNGVLLVRNERDYIYVEPGSSMTTQEISEFASFIYKNNQQGYSSSFYIPQQDNKTNGFLYYIVPVPDPTSIVTQKAILVMSVNPSLISNIFYKYYETNSNDAAFTVTDYNGNLIASMPKDLPFDIDGFNSNMLESGYYVDSDSDYNQLVMNARMDTIGWFTTITVPMEKVLTPIKSYQTTFVFSVFFSLLMVIFILYISTKSISFRLHEMITVMNHVKEGKINSRFPVKYNDEISIIGSEFNNMIDNIQHLQLDIVQLKLHQREAELHALQSQINPHFLYNTLETIRMVAIDGKTEAVSEQIQSLSDMFHYTVSSTGINELVYIWQEIDHVYSYLKIQNFRFADRFDVQVHIDEAILSYKTLKLILQPIVENAFMHGVHSMKHGGRIYVSGWSENGNVYLCVSDNGVGISDESLAKLRKELSATPYEPRIKDSIGFINVNDRLKLSFGEQYVLDIDSKLDKGTTVTIKIPIMGDDSNS